MAKDVSTKMDKLGAKLDDMKQKLQKWEQNTEAKIQEHPVQSVLISFGAGVLAGAILAAMMRRR